MEVSAADEDEDEDDELSLKNAPVENVEDQKRFKLEGKNLAIKHSLKSCKDLVNCKNKIYLQMMAPIDFKCNDIKYSCK